MDLCYKLGLCAGIPGRKHREISTEQVKQFLIQNPTFLDEYVVKNIDLDTIEGWILDRTKAGRRRTSSLARWKFGLHANKQIMLQEMAISFHKERPEEGVMWELALCICSAINADQFILFIRRGDNELRLLQEDPKNKKSLSFNIEEELVMACYAAKERKPLRLSTKEAENKFPQGLGLGELGGGMNQNFCHPIIKADGELFGVILLQRKNPEMPFFREDEEIVNSYLIWGGISVHYVEINMQMNKQKMQNEFLLNVVKSIFHDMVSMDLVIRKIMNFAQRLVDADRASLFLVDQKSREVFARLFDMGNGTTSSGAANNGPVKEIRFPIGTGIAGKVAEDGMILNIKNAYSDERFNRKVDQMTGYTTKTILCMPILIRDNIIGVVQMVNKKNGHFTDEDEKAFETFAIYCGLALYHAKLYDKIRRSEQKYKVALEVLSYHNSCNEEEVARLKECGVPERIIGLDNFYFITSTIDDFQKVQYAIFMFVDLFGLQRFDLDSITRFCLTVRKNYRRVPYHNWVHGFTVAHSEYCILKKTTVFQPLESLALYIGALCHDLDHRGKNNKFMLETASPLASIYTTSTLEHHHFNQTVTILQQEGHNIFSKLSSDEYKQVLGKIKHCILATDLATFFPTKAKVQAHLAENTFTWGQADHRLQISAIAMTAADLCASAKPWEAQVETVKVIFEEFYEQGDFEKQNGIQPIPMMDRNQSHNQAESQVGFLSGICIPCYEILCQIIPETKPLLEGCQRNLEIWKRIDEEVKRKGVKNAVEYEQIKLAESSKAQQNSSST